MIVPAKSPFAPPGSAVAALHVSLNTPVVSLEVLPVGPATAAVALHPPPLAGATLAVRSVRTGHIAFFVSERGAADRPDRALEAVLTFAESLGFLFDDDEVADGDAPLREAAARHWCDWLGEEDVELDPTAMAVSGLDPDPMPTPALLLSKFRRTPTADGGPGGPGPDLRLRLTSRF